MYVLLSSFRLFAKGSLRLFDRSVRFRYRRTRALVPRTFPSFPRITAPHTYRINAFSYHSRHLTPLCLPLRKLHLPFLFFQQFIFLTDPFIGSTYAICSHSAQEVASLRRSSDEQFSIKCNRNVQLGADEFPSFGVSALNGGKTDISNGG